MNREDVLKTVFSIFEQVASIPCEQLREDTAFADLDLDSVDFMKIMLGVEETFGFEFRNEDLNLEGYGDFGRFVNFLMQHYLSEREDGAPLVESGCGKNDTACDRTESHAPRPQDQEIEPEDCFPPSPNRSKGTCGASRTTQSAGTAEPDSHESDRSLLPREGEVSRVANDVIKAENQPLSGVQTQRGVPVVRPVVSQSEGENHTPIEKGESPHDQS